MPKVVKRTYSLTAEQAAYIDRKVASGEYASGSEVIRESLRASQACRHAIGICRIFVDEDAVLIARTLYGGQKWRNDLSGKDETS